MDIKKYEMFLKIMETGSLSKTAGELGCTQSAITHMMQSLERDMGFTLMVRNKAGVKLTEQGEKLLPLIQEVVDSNNRLKRSAELIKYQKSKNSVIRIGTFKSMAVNWLPKIIKEFQREHKNIEFQLIDGDYDDLGKWVSDSEIDIHFVNMDIGTGLKSIPLCEDRLLAVLPKGHPMAGDRVFPVEEFEKEPVISLIDNTDQDARNILARAGVKPQVKLKTKDEFAMLAMVENGLGICIMPELMLMGRTEKVKVMELMPPASRMIGLAVAETDKQEAVEFSEFIAEWVRKNYIRMKL